MHACVALRAAHDDTTDFYNNSSSSSSSIIAEYYNSLVSSWWAIAAIEEGIVPRPHHKIIIHFTKSGLLLYDENTRRGRGFQ